MSIEFQILDTRIPPKFQILKLPVLWVFEILITPKPKLLVAIFHRPTEINVHIRRLPQDTNLVFRV